MRLFLWNMLLALVWALSTATFTPHNLLLGFVLGLLTLKFFAPLPEGGQYFRKLSRLALFVLFYAKEVSLSSFAVARQVLSPRTLRPAIVAVPLKAESDGEITVLSNLISYAPGSLCVDISDDRRTMYVHVMSLDDADAFRSSVQDDLEARILGIVR